MLLKYALDNVNAGHARNHDLYDLFRKLPRPRRRAVERKYREILSSREKETWDFARSVETFLQYLGDDAITDSRYFWERPHTAEISILFFPDKLYSLIYALFIELHNYPQQGSIEKRYATKFLSFEDSLSKDKKQ